MPEQDEKAKAEGKAETPTYAVDRLTAEAQDRFGVPSHVAAGAFSGQRKKNFTLDEAKQLIEKFAKHVVEVDNPIGEEG